MDKSILKERFIKAKRALFEKVYSEFLNPEQMRAVFTTEGPLLVLAGAGSGKTTVLVNRVVYIIKYGNAYFSERLPEGVDEQTVLAMESALELPTETVAEILPQFITDPCPPWSVLAITFTNKAAGEIKSRLVDAFGDEEMAKSIWAGTFHSICLRVLRKWGERVGLREGFSIYDTDDKKRMIAQCMKELDIDEKRLGAKAIASAISIAKDNLTPPEDMQIERDPRTKDIKAVYELYQKKMMANNAVDFDDIIMLTVELLQDNEDILEYYQHKFRYVLVDEYQDTNYAQFVLTKLLADGRRNIMVVGDDDQSIYRFRGATIENILNFDTTYADATVVKLEQNYRSTANILAAANAVIANNRDRHQKKLWCAKGDGEKITVKEAFDQNDEGKYIVDKVIKGVRLDGRKYSDFAVLYRVNALGRALQTAFTKSGVPFRVVGDMGFYDRKEVKDMVAYLSVVSYPGDNLRLKRIINEPKRKIGAATVEAIETLASGNGLSMYNIIERIDEYPVLSKSRDKLTSFLSLIEGIRNRCTLPSEILTALFEESGYKAMLEGEGFEGEGKIENVNELITAALEYEKRMADLGEPASLQGFLEEVFLISDVDKYDDSADAVVLMTVHAAKGLEFPVVFLAGMEDGIFPSEQDKDDPSEMSEERRLAYVAITRAKEQLYISYAKERLMYGRTLYGRLSCFVREELPASLTARDVPRREPPRRTSYYTSPQRESAPWGTPTRVSGEIARRPDIGNAQPKRGAEKFGLDKFSSGDRVKHGMFGLGTVVSARDMGGDILYEVAFDNGQSKKLMATYAKLERAGNSPMPERTDATTMSEPLTTGDRVENRVFGRGTVLSLDVIDGSEICTVMFDIGAVKKIAYDGANLKKI